ncbi:MAG TPA: TIM barrel protein, partial [Anaerolineaceae bacterium]|nr:TIM barrel protein [Anaerolineaceae bacterium]
GSWPFLRGLFKFPYPSKARGRFPLETIDAGLYQKWRDARSLLDYHCQEQLPASLEYARAIHAPKVVIFSFERSSDWPGVSAPDEVLECLLSAAAAAQPAGVELVIEVEERFWADTGAHTAELLERIDHPALGVNWDPGNAAAASDRGPHRWFPKGSGRAPWTDSGI